MLKNWHYYSYTRIFDQPKPNCMRILFFFLLTTLFLASSNLVHAQWCQRISADYLAPGVNIGITQNDGSHWVAGLYRGFLEIPGPGGPFQFNSPTSGDPSEYRYTGYIARYLADGNLAWAKEIRSNFNRLVIQHLTPAPDGSVIVIGMYNGPIVFNQGEPDQFVLQGNTESVFMARFQANGGLMWAKALPGNGMFFTQIAFSHWHNNELYLAVQLNMGDLDFDPGTGTTRLFSPFLLPNQQNYCFGRYSASGDLIQAGQLARGIALSVGQLVSIGQKLALPLTFSDSVQLYMGQTTAMQSIRAAGFHAATVLSPDLSSVSGTYQTSPAEFGDTTTGFMIDLAVVDNQLRQIVGVGLGKLRINPNNPNDTIVAMTGSTYTQYEVVLDSQANYLSHQLISAFTGPTAAARYARGDADSLIMIFAAPGFIVNGVTYNATRTNDQMAAVLLRDVAGFQLKKTAKASMFSVPLIASGGGHQYFQMRWQDSLHFDGNYYHSAPLSRQFIELCKLNDNGLSLGTDDLTSLKQTVQLYPNPASSSIHLQLTSITTTRIQFMDIQGKTHFQRELNGTTETTFDVAELPAGLYFCRWESAGQVGHIKWVKQ